MPSGWTNDTLESLIKGKESLSDVGVPNGWFEFVASQIIELPDELAVELARIAIMNLAIRHAGGDLSDMTVSQEGVEYSVLRVLDLMKESATDGD